MKHRMTLGLAAVSVFALAACSDTAGPNGSALAFDELVTLDVAMVAADGVLENLAAMQQSFGGALGTAPMTGTRTVTFLDADGNQQDAFDELTTATIHIVSEFSGEVDRESWSASMLRTRDMTISGLEGEETTRTANGSGTVAVTRSRHTDDSGTRTHEMTGTSLVDNVVHGVPREENPYPLSGSITMDMTVNITNGPDGDVTRTRTVVVTFNGTQFATMTVDGESFEVDLSTRSGGHPFRRRGR